MKTSLGFFALILLATGCGNTNTTSVATGEGGTPGGKQYAEDEQWLTNLPDALAKANTDNKLVLLDFTGSDWCLPCKMLHDKVLTQKKFLDHASENLVLVMLDFPSSKPQADQLKEANRKLAKKFNIEGYPTLVLLDSEGNELAREVGLAHQNPDDLIAWVKDKGPK